MNELLCIWMEIEDAKQNIQLKYNLSRNSIDQFSTHLKRFSNIHLTQIHDVFLLDNIDLNVVDYKQAPSSRVFCYFE